MRRTPPKSVQPPAEKLTLTFTPELKEALVKKAREMFGERKGAISIYAEMVFRRELNMNIEGVKEI